MSVSLALDATIKRAQQVLAAHEAALGGVASLWQREGETVDDFNARVLTARTRLPPKRLLVAVGERGIAASQGVRVVELPPKMLPLLTQAARYRVGYGGRAGGRSWSFGRGLLVRALERRRLILCARELQVSLAESVYRLLVDQIDRLGLSHLFEVQATTITAYNGSEIIFAGIRNNVSKIKSMEGVSICFVEEAERISHESWEVLIPTIRAAGSEIWLGFNPDLADDPTFEKFVTHPPDSAVVVKTTWRDNPWFNPVLAAEKDYLARVDMDAYHHVWEGEVRRHSAAQILAGKVVIESFEPQPTWGGPYFGLDFGFSQDPTAGIRCYVDDATRTLYIEREAWALGCDIDRTPALLDSLGDDVRAHLMRADCARPETISYLGHHGYPNVIAAAKWSGSVEDGVAHLRSYERIVVHPRCTHTLEEARLYSYKIDRLTSDVLPEIVDKHNHCMDAVRYALAPLIQARGAGLLAFYQAELAKDAAAPPTAWPVPSRSLTERAKTEGAITQDLISPWHLP